MGENYPADQSLIGCKLENLIGAGPPGREGLNFHRSVKLMSFLAFMGYPVDQSLFGCKLEKLTGASPPGREGFYFCRSLKLTTFL